jgi:hypothetical protein
MSILIKGMKMPDCWNCPCLDGEYGECNILGKTIKGGNGRRADCPLVEVPDHASDHDAEEKWNEIAERSEEECEDENWCTELDDPKIAERSESDE